MDYKDLRVLHITKKELKSYLLCPSSERSFDLPLSDNKAMWLLEKPNMSDDDYCAIIAIGNKDLLSFCYLVPESIPSIDGKTYWMPQWWVSKSVQNPVISTFVFREALNAIDKKVITKAYEENAAAFYKKQPFSIIGTTVRHSIFIAFDSNMATQKISFLKHFKFFSKFLEKSSFRINTILNRSKIKRLSKDLKIKYIHKMDVDGWSFVKPFLQNDFIPKTQEYLNWQIDSRQYLLTPLETKRKNKAVIKGFGKNIGIVNYQIFHHDKMIGFVSLHYYKTIAYLKYSIAEQEYMAQLSSTIYEHMSELGLTYLFTDNQILSESFNDNLFVFFHHKQTKKAMAHNSIHKQLKTNQLMEQDGHFN